MKKKRGRPISQKISLSPERVKEVMHYRKTSLRKMDADQALDLSGKTISRALKTKEITPENLERLGEYLNVDITVLSGRYDQIVEELIQKREIPANYRDSFQIEEHPYVHPSLRNQSIQNIVHAIFVNVGLLENSQDNLPFPEKILFICDIENAINGVLHKYFDYSYLYSEYEVLCENNHKSVRLTSTPVESRFNAK